MTTIQNSVLKKFYAAQDDEQVQEAYNKFRSHFLDSSMQDEIRRMNEEEYQDGFLNDLFVNILGYTLRPYDGYQLIREKKNQNDAKKADGAIQKDGHIIAVIELKGTSTKDLSKIDDQAFGYKRNHPGCDYVITSNFEKLRFYIRNAVDKVEFNLFTLTLDQFKLLWLFLQKDNLLSGIPLKVKEESLLEEEKVTYRLYNDYSAFKSDLWNDMCQNNPETDELELYKKSQKLLDRFLFIFFAEDKGLLPPNSISVIVDDWNKLKDLDAYKPLYSRFQKYFGYMNDGFKGKNYEIHAYNGGLFKADPLLDTLTITDELLEKNVLKLTEYDFETEVDTNILGHIFEHSLNDIENVRAQLAGEEVDKSKTKRKKDGVFYTPKYITKYIVDNTVGKLCEEKKQELGIDEEEFAKDRKGRRKDTIKKLDALLKDYREWLLQLTICDPACGSGAFLNQALEFLMAEHRYVDELESQLLGYAMVFPDVENHILERNIYGVDINEESVEIARLSLWLRTAKKGRKLTSLSSNIKVGNSLIDDPEVAGVLAFNWQEQFPTVFEKGGFDVVIGNPPYVRKQGLMEHYPEMCEFYEYKYVSATANYDIYALFMERSYDLINSAGEVSFILPHKFLVADFGVGIRTFFKSKKAVKSLVHFGSEMVFADASTYTCIINLSKSERTKLLFKKVKPLEVSAPFSWDYTFYDDLSEENWDLQSQLVFELVQKLYKQPYTVADVFDRIFQGIASGGDKFFSLMQVSQGEYYSEMLEKVVAIESGIVKPFVKGNQVSRYEKVNTDFYTLFPYSVVNGKATPKTFKEIEDQFPKAAVYYRECESFLREREKGRFNNDEEWFLFSRKQGISGVEYPKIITQEISLGCNMTYDEKGEYYHATTIYSFVRNKAFEVDEKFYLGILNSKVMWFFLKNTGTELRGGYFRFKTNYLKPFPLPEIPQNADELIVKVNRILSVNEELQKVVGSFVELVGSNFPIDKFPKKLQNWPELEFKGFLAELKKKKVKLTPEEKAEWLDYFNKKKTEANALQAEIDRIDKEIDQMVYELYGLTEDEIMIVEKAI